MKTSRSAVALVKDQHKRFKMSVKFLEKGSEGVVLLLIGSICIIRNDLCFRGYQT